MRRLVFLSAFAVALACGCAPAFARQTTHGAQAGYQIRDIRGSVPVPTPARLRIVAEVGNINLTASSGDTLTYRVELRLRGGAGARAALDNWPVSVRRSGDLILVSAAGVPEGRRGSARIDVAVPSAVRQTRVHTAVGNVSASGLAGSLVAQSAAGNIDADAIAGAAQIETAAGNVTLGRIGGPVHASTAGGNIRLASAGGDATLESQGGDLTVLHAAGALHLVTAGGSIRVGSAAGDVVAETEGGNINLGAIAGRVRSQTSGGNIEVASSAAAECQTGGGSLRLRQVAGPVEASTAAGAIFARITATSATFGDSLLRSGVGDITVFLPPGLPVTVSADLSDALGHHLSSDFAALEQAAHWQGGSLVVRAPLSGGGPVLRLISSSSNISVRKEH